jgi:SAM-dependent methyltransferase/acyl carrier protein
VDFACYNGAHSFVLAGDEASIGRAEEALHFESIKTTRLRNTHAYHSYLTDDILSEYEDLVKTIKVNKPRYKLEPCSQNDRPWEFSVRDIVQHTRLPVFFHDAVQRITSQLPSALWLEAGSAAPIITMARRILTTEFKQHNNIFIPQDLRGNNALQSISQAACQLWKAGCQGKYWLFHKSERHQYGHVNLPPYQFEKIKHWIQYKARSEVPEIESPSKLADVRSELVSFIKKDNVSELFGINTSHATFRLASTGHAVVGQSLCPASMYVEFASRCAMLLAGDSVPGLLPRIEDLTMSAPLGLVNTGVFLRMARPNSSGPWTFTIVSQHDRNLEEIEHARGRISLEHTESEIVESRLKLLNRLSRSTRYDQMMVSPNATGLSGPMVYKVFRDVVDYAPYYHGVKSLYGYDNEAVGLVSMPSETASGMESGVCDPISLDTFLQVAGIHVNCLSDRKAEEVFMCTNIEEMVFTSRFLNDRRENRTWIVYTRFEPLSRTKISNDIFIRESESKELVLCVIGAIFKSVPFKMVASSLTKLNGISAKATVETRETPSAPGIDNQQDDPGYHSQDTVTPDSDDTKPFSGDFLSAETLVSMSVSSITADNSGSQLVDDMCKLLSDIIEIPVSEISHTARFDDLGIDSLLVTEVVSEIEKQLGVTITTTEFQQASDILSLCRRIQPESVPVTIPSTEVLKEEKGDISSSSIDSGKHTNLNSQHAATASNIASIGCECFEQVKTVYDHHARTTGFSEFRTRAYPLQAQLVLQYVVEAFKILGVDLRVTRPGEAVDMIPYIPRHRKLVRQLYNVLEDGGLVKQDNGVYSRTSKEVSDVSSSKLHADMLSQYPQHTAETKLLHSTACKLADCLLGKVDPLGILFGDAQARALLEDMYTNAPMFKAGTLLLADYLSSMLTRSSTFNRPVKILELGAGTGGTTKKLLESLTSTVHDHNFTYTFTDLSSSLVAAARRKFTRYPFTEYSVLDVEASVPSEFEGQFDIVISTNCIHATRDLVVSGSHIRQMLRPDGILCLVETTRNLFWFDLVFGLLEGWWLATDGRGHPLSTEKEWDRDLRAAGFRWVDWSSGSSEESDIVRVITASPMEVGPDQGRSSTIDRLETRETVVFKHVDGLDLCADIYYPPHPVTTKSLPVGEQL